MTTAIILFILFFGLGIMFSLGKGAMLIAGYNTKSDAEKAKYNERALCTAMATMMFVIAFSFIIDMIGYWRNEAIWNNMSVGIMIAVIIFGLIYMNTSKKIKQS